MMKKKSVTLTACKEEAPMVCDSLLFKKKIPIQHSLSELTSSKLKALKSKLDCVPAYPCVMSLI